MTPVVTDFDMSQLDVTRQNEAVEAVLDPYIWPLEAFDDSLVTR